MEQNNETPIQPGNEKKKIPVSVPAAIITAGVLIAIALILGRDSDTAPTMRKNAPGNEAVEQPLAPVTLRSDDALRGDPKASIVVVEYSDSDCPFCQRFHETMKEVVTTSKGTVAWVYRHFPLSIHPNARNEAIALACVKNIGGNEAFWNFLDTVIDVTLTPEKSTAMFTTIAKEQKIDSALFATCLVNPSIAKMIDEQSAEAQALGARGTPFSVVLNTKTGAQKVIPGALPIEEVQKIIASLQ